MSAYVYTLWGSGPVPLYIGCTRHLPQRLDTHRRERHWWPEVKRIELAWFADVEEAFSVEAGRIARMWPLHNVMHNPRYPCAEDVGRPTARDRKEESLWQMHRENGYRRIFEAAA